MSAAVALMLEGMPSPWDLHLHRAAGRVVVLAGSTVVAEYGETDLAMRNMVIVTLRRVGFPGWRVAEVFGLTPTYVARLKSAVARAVRPAESRLVSTFLRRARHGALYCVTRIVFRSLMSAADAAARISTDSGSTTNLFPASSQ